MGLVTEHLSASAGGDGLIAISGSLYLTAKDSDNPGEIRFVEADGANYIGFKGNDSIGSDHTYTLPADYPDDDKLLQSTDAGVLTWESAGGGSGAPADTQYVTLAVDGDLSAERVITAGDNITLADGGAGGALTISVTGGKRFITLHSMPIKGGSTTDTMYIMGRSYIGTSTITYTEVYGAYFVTGATLSDNPPGTITRLTSPYYDAANDSNIRYGGDMVLPVNAQLVSGSFSAVGESVGRDVEALHIGLAKMPSQESSDESGGSITGSLEGDDWEFMPMYWHTIDANTTDADDFGYTSGSVFAGAFECTGSLSHLTASAGDMMVLCFSGEGNEMGSWHLRASWVFEVSDRPA